MKLSFNNAWSRYFLAVFAGVLLALAFLQIGVAGFAWVAPALMLVAAYESRGWESFRTGYVAGLAFWLTSLYWLLLIPVKWFPILGWIALSAYVAVYFAIWVWLLAGRMGRGHWSQRTLWSLAGAAAWVALEMVRARLFSGFPWNLLGASQYQLTPLIQIASVTGVYGVSFLVVWTSLSLFNAALVILRQPTRRLGWQSEIILPLVVVVALFAYGQVRLRETNSSDKSILVTMVQPGIPQTMIWDEKENDHRFSELLALSEKALGRGTEVLIWPEAALPEFNEASFVAITNLIRRHHVWMIFGADDIVSKANPTAGDKYDFYNAAFLLNPDGQFAGVYHKQKLVIFGEYIPLARWLPFMKWFTPVTGSYASGDKPVPFELNRWGERPREPKPETTSGSSATSPLPNVKISTLICFEDVFPHLAREYVDDDTDLLVNLTNDGWFGEGAEQWQHAAAGVFRAVENGVPLLRCCNNGLTCSVDQHGRLDILLDKNGRIYGPGFMPANLGLKKTVTFYRRHGDWFGWSCVAFTSAIVLVKAREIIKKGHCA